jgi:hypothetical protein
LAPPRYSALASWITGWANITGQVENQISLVATTSNLSHLDYSCVFYRLHVVGCAFTYLSDKPIDLYIYSAQMVTTAIAVSTDGATVLGAGATYGILLAILFAHGIVCSAATNVLARLNLMYVLVNGEFHINLAQRLLILVWS